MTMVDIGMDLTQVILLRICSIGGSLERYSIPLGSADWAAKVSMFDIVGNTNEVERVGALSSEDGLALPCSHVTQANGAIFLYTKQFKQKSDIMRWPYQCSYLSTTVQD